MSLEPETCPICGERNRCTCTPPNLRVGDVVQSPNRHVGIVVECTGRRIMVDDGEYFAAWQRSVLHRIGRARYMPDGTPVED